MNITLRRAVPIFVSTFVAFEKQARPAVTSVNRSRRSTGRDDLDLSPPTEAIQSKKDFNQKRQ